MALHSVQDIEQAIEELKPDERAELYSWMEQQRSEPQPKHDMSVFEEGLGLFGSPEDAAMLDEIVKMIYEERRRPSRDFDA